MLCEEANGKSSELVADESDEDASEAQAQVIASLRAQVTDLFSQVTQLNNKLVSSYDRVSDLEDQLHDTSSSLRNATITISSLELERSHHLAALNTGLLVEKAHVTAELNRLMERATEEAARRGQAETARHDIEKDLDDLSATLFDQANTMVAEARLNQARSDRKVQDAEQALKIAEDAVKDMQVQMQVLQAEKETAERDVQDTKLTMSKGKCPERYDPRTVDVPRIRFMIVHTPYTEFIAFITHLRRLRASQPTSPAISTLLAQPFIARLLTEDSEPTVRLDLAPSLNWLSRRSVIAAIYSGMLTVEPLSFSTLVQELQQYPQSTSSSCLSCALCGTLIARLSSSPVSRAHHTNGGSWFKYPLALSSSQNNSTRKSHSTQSEAPGQVYIFRIAAATTSTPSAVPTPVRTSSVPTPGSSTSSRPPLNAIPSSRVLPTQTQNSPYPLCASNYCMTRLRSTCSLWAFVRTGIVERIWEELAIQTPKPLANGDGEERPPPLTTVGPGNQCIGPPPSSEKPPVPPRRRRLWEMASAFGERAVSWSKEGGESTKEKGKDTEIEKETLKDGGRRLPTPPPSHPSVPHSYANPSTSESLGDPPPLPKRNVIRIGSADLAPSSDTQNEIALPETKDSVANMNGHDGSDRADHSMSGPSTPLDEITFATPSSSVSPLPPTTPAESNAPPSQDQPPSSPLDPSTIPLPITPPASNPVSRVTSPTPRPRSQHSSVPPANSRPSSPAVSRSRTGSPIPARPAPQSPGASMSHIRGKTSISSPLASSRPASPAPATGPGAPPLPRRAAARRAVPPPPTPGKQEVGKEDATLPIAVVANTTSEADVHRAGDANISAETENHDNSGENGKDVVEDTTVPEVRSEPAKADDANARHEPAEEVTNGASVTVPSETAPPPASEGDGRTSIDTTSTKRSSATEGECFASDTTWEERTWKELARLREEMFWARMGGVRATQE